MQCILAMATGLHRRQLSTVAESVSKSLRIFKPVFAIVAAGSLMFAYDTLPEYVEQERIRSLIRSGHCSPQDCGPRGCLPRPELEERLKHIFTPNEKMVTTTQYMEGSERGSR